MTVKKHSENDTSTKAARRGRPVTGKAKTSTERGKAADAALLASGGRILNRLRLRQEPAAALDVLTAQGGTDREAIEQALIDAANKIN